MVTVVLLRVVSQSSFVGVMSDKCFCRSLSLEGYLRNQITCQRLLQGGSSEA